MGYIANFIVYTLAMVGVIVFALFVFKNTTTVTGKKSSKYLNIIDSISLGQRKMLYIVSAGREKFLVAGDVDRTSLISRLELDDIDYANKNNGILEEKKDVRKTFQETMKSLPEFGYMDKSILANKMRHELNPGTTSINTSAMRSLAERIKK